MKRSHLLYLVLRCVYEGTDIPEEGRHGIAKKAEYERMFRDSKKSPFIKPGYSDSDRPNGSLRPMTQPKA